MSLEACAAPAIPLVVIMGATASGKSALALQLAEHFSGEIVSADALAIYRYLDIGTAKPLAEERARVPHHCLDLLDPQEPGNAALWLQHAEQAVRDIHARGKLPIVAGGTPLYVKLLLEGMSAGPPQDPSLRAALVRRYHEVGGEALLQELQRIDPRYASERHANDEKRIIRALEVFHLSGKPYSSFHTTDGLRRPDWRALLVGLRWERDVLNQRINARAKQMFARGLIDEVRSLAERLGATARAGVGYKEVLAHVRGSCSAEEALEQVKKASRHLAKHQLTWYRRFADIHWLPGEAPDLFAQASLLLSDFLRLENACG